MPDANITKSALARAMKKLMRKKDFQRISVTDICESCGMNRKSFYYHFKDKYDLMNWIFYTEFISKVTSEPVESGWELLVSVMDLFYNDQDFYKSALRTEGQNSFWEYVHDSMLPIVTFTIEDSFEDDKEAETMMEVFCDTCLSAAMQWLEHGCTVPPREFIENIKRLILAIASTIKQ